MTETNYFNMMLYRDMVEHYNLSNPMLIRYFLKVLNADQNAPFWYSEMHHIGIAKCTILVYRNTPFWSQWTVTMTMTGFGFGHNGL